MTDLDDYRILEPLAEGAFGALVLAEAPDGERVVIKRLKLDNLLDDKASALFEREAGVLRSLRHPAMPRFIDSGVDAGGVPYLVQEHIDGPTLQRAVASGRRFETRGADRLTRDLLDALAYLHGLHPPVIHRDIKPANILLEGERPVIVDFGAVCGHALLAEEVSETVVGTFGYMAPEMLKGHASPASDLYALGATLLFAFSGREPESFPTKRLRIEFREALNLPDPLADLLEALLEPAVEDRPKSAAEALALLDRRPPPRALARRPERPPAASRDEGSQRPVRRLGKVPVKYVAAGTLTVTLVVLLALFPAVFKTIALVGLGFLVLVVVLAVVSGAF